MSVEAVKAYLKAWGKDGAVREFAVSSATTALAAAAVGVEPARIAKTLAFGARDGNLIVVVAGDVRVDNAKFKARFGSKGKMLSSEEALAVTGHPVGGVCPFALPDPAPPVWLDVSLRRFASVFPAAGSANSAVEMTCDELFACSRARGWVDVGKYA